MSEILLHYKQVEPATWIYLSSLLTIALYFKFNRFWSIRNLDLLGLIVLAPGMLLATRGVGFYEYLGYVWLFSVGGLFMLRLCLDFTMVRRPLLEPNLSVGGLTFLGCSLFLFLMANVATARVHANDLAGVAMAEQMQGGEKVQNGEAGAPKHGPGYPILFWLVHEPAKRIVADDQDASQPTQRQQSAVQHLTARLVAILAHFFVVSGMVLIGYFHFDNIRMGIAAATLYLLLPYTAHLTGRVDHVLPAALLVWAALAYRQPMIAGLLIGLAAGFNYYPIFLLPLWLSFYWQRGLVRFLSGVLVMLISLVGILALMSADLSMFFENVRQMFGIWLPRTDDVTGLWRPEYSIYRLPVLAVFVVLSLSLAIWPAQKNFGTLLSGSAAIMLATQFWVAQEGGLYMGWYLPLLVLTIFRPNLEDRVALSVLSAGWFRGRKRSGPTMQAA